MTRRIALAILLTVWATLIACGATAYLATRAVLLADLDASLVDRAIALPKIDERSGQPVESIDSDRSSDRYIVRDELGRTVARPTTAPTMHAPQMVRAAFVTLPDGSRMRSITVRATARREDGEPLPVTISYSGSAVHFDTLLRSLGWSLLAACTAGGLLAAGIAQAVAARSLLPLRHTAEVVGSIDEQCLNRRISEQNLPPELLSVARRLNEMLARLEESTRQRQQFMADASHELRTPVAALVTALEVALRRPRDAQSYRSTLQTCLVDAHLLQQLVETLLDQARSGLAQLQEPDQIVEIGDLVEECVTVLGPLAQKRSIRIESSGHRGTQLRTQPQRLRSILLNLLGNAIEYNREGGEVWVEVREEHQNLVVEVRDNGPGIAAKHLAHLFDPLFRVDSARASGHLGLGLYLVKTHAQALGGRCTVRSEPGVGTSFDVVLPDTLTQRMQHNSGVPQLAPTG